MVVCSAATTVTHHKLSDKEHKGPDGGPEPLAQGVDLVGPKGYLNVEIPALAAGGAALPAAVFREGFQLVVFCVRVDAQRLAYTTEHLALPFLRRGAAGAAASRVVGAGVVLLGDLINHRLLRHRRWCWEEEKKTRSCSSVACFTWRSAAWRPRSTPCRSLS